MLSSTSTRSFQSLFLSTRICAHLAGSGCCRWWCWGFFLSLTASFLLGPDEVGGGDADKETSGAGSLGGGTGECATMLRPLLVAEQEAIGRAAADAGDDT